MKDLYSECRKFVQDRIEQSAVLRTDWLAAEFLETKGEVFGEAVPFYRACAVNVVTDTMKRCVGKYDSRPERADDQLILPGFDHLQKAYTVVRDGVNVLVPIDMLTDDEMVARAKEYDAMAVGCRAHAREIREYLSSRRDGAAA